MTPPVAFYLLAWVFSVQHPTGAITDRAEFYSNKYTKQQCENKAVEADKLINAELKKKHQAITTDGGTAIYSRFICVPVPK